MEHKIEIFWINGPLPEFEISKFTLLMSEFDTRCENLSRYVPFVMMLFQWMGAHDDKERICSLQHLGHKLYRALADIKTIHEQRRQLLCDEHCDKFEELMGLIQTHSWRMINFINEAETMFTEACRKNALDTGQLRLIAQYGEICQWLKQLSKDSQRLDEAAQKCCVKSLSCNMRIFDVELEGIRHHFEAVKSCLMLLTIPCHIKSSDEEMVRLFRSSFSSFLSGEYWKEYQEGYADKLNDEFDTDTTDKERIQLLKNRKRQIKDELRQFLSQFDISYTGIDTDERTCKLARRLYVRLNNVYYKKRGGDLKAMNNNSLCRYFTLEGKMHYLSAEIARLEERQKLPVTNRSFNNGYFTDQAPRDLIRQAIYAVIHHRRSDGRLLLSAQSHWMAIYKVLQEGGHTCGTMKQFCELMQVWFSDAEHPCNYNSMKNVASSDVKNNDYSAWQRRDPKNRAYLAIADELVRQMQELKVA